MLFGRRPPERVAGIVGAGVHRHKVAGLIDGRPVAVYMVVVTEGLKPSIKPGQIQYRPIMLRPPNTAASARRKGENEESPNSIVRRAMLPVR